MKYPFSDLRIIAAFALAALFGAPVSAAEWAGSYHAAWSYSPTLVKTDGTKEKLPARNVEWWIELQPDQGLKVRRNEDGHDYDQWGAWRVADGRLYFFVQQRYGDQVWSYFGCQAVRQVGGGLILSETLGAPLATSGERTTEFSRAESLAVKIAAPDGFAGASRRKLDDMLALKADFKFVGAASEAELRERMRTAFSAGDIAELMRLTYPIAKQLLPDYDSPTSTFLHYVNQLGEPGAIEFKDEGREAAEKSLADLKSSGCGFPSFVSARGMMWITRRRKNDSFGSPLFIGKAAGRWAILGHALALDEIEARKAKTDKKE